MKGLSRLLLAPTLAAVLLLARARRMPRIESADRLMTGLGVWQSTLCAGPAVPCRVAVRIVGGRVYSADQSYQSNGAVGANGVVRVSVAGGGLSARVPAGYRTIPVQDDGGLQITS